MNPCRDCPSRHEIPSCPTFLVIGGQKCGTSWLYKMITQHHEVNDLSAKELHYFNKEANLRKGKAWYFDKFKCDAETRAVGEYTPNYLFCAVSEMERCESDIPENIPHLVKQNNEHTRLIVILRNPVKRAVSAYFHHIRAGRISYKSRLKDVLDRFGIKTMGYYATHLEKWYQYFPESSFLILFFEEDLLKNSQLNTIKRAYSHIGVNPDFTPENMERKYNAAASHYNMVMRNYLSENLTKAVDRVTPGIIKRSPRWNIPVYEEEIEELRRIYEPHNERLSQLLGRELPW